MDISINGRFLGRTITGVERFGRELLLSLDAAIPRMNFAGKIRILIPQGTSIDLCFKYLEMRVVGRFRGHLWEQVDLPRFAKDDLLLSFANSAPAFHFRQLVVVHDAAVYRFPENYSRSYRILHQSLGRILARNASLATVSRFSRAELSEVLRIPAERILVIPNGRDHLGTLSADFSVLEKLGLQNKSYFLAVGSPSKNKNTSLLAAAWSYMSNPLPLVIVGTLDTRVFGPQQPLMVGEHIISAGRVSDPELAALYQKAEAFIFPSLYEGFGIPPVEALSYGCPVIVSDIPALRETCGENATYFDPTKPAELARIVESWMVKRILGQGLSETTSNPVQSWQKSADNLIGWIQSQAT